MNWILRPYQTEAMLAAKLKLVEHRSTLIEMATGLGKTVLFAHLADEWPGRVLVIAHRDELIRQAAEKIQSITGHACAVEMGRERVEDTLYGTKIVVGSIQTLARANRRERFHPDHFGLIVIDEGHHATAVTYREVLGYFSSAKHLFVTATANRSDEVGLEHVCESVAYRYGIEQAIMDGWLVPVKQQVVKIDGLDFSKARTLAGDFNEADLERILTEEKALHSMCSSAFEILKHRQSLWFCTSVVHARATAGVLRRYTDPKNVAFLSGDTPIEERRSTVDSYKRGNIQHMVNCALFLEGFDAPSTSGIVMGRPTKSLSLYVQVLGRGTRPLPNTVDGIEHAEQRREAIALSDKPDMLVVDFAGNAGKHKIIQVEDVLGGKYEPPVRQYAKETMEKEGCPVSIDEALERAKEEMELLAEEEERRRKITATAAYRTYDVDPFSHSYTGQSPKNGKPEVKMCSPRQARYIGYLSWKTGRGDWTTAKALKLTARQVQGVIAQLKSEL